MMMIRRRIRGCGLPKDLAVIVTTVLIGASIIIRTGHGFVPTRGQPPPPPPTSRPQPSSSSSSNNNKVKNRLFFPPLLLARQQHLSEADKDRLLMGEVAMTAFIVAEMEHFANTTMTEFDNDLRYERKWELSAEELLQFGLANSTTTSSGGAEDGGIRITNQEYLDATEQFQTNSTMAVELIVNTTRQAFTDGYRETGLLSALGSAILYFKQYYQATPTHLAACERIGLSDYQVAHHITDMYHHRTFRGTYTKTLPASGRGEIAARIAVGLEEPPQQQEKQPKDATKEEKGSRDDPPAATSAGAVAAKELPQQQQEEEQEQDDDECLCWSPTTPGLCLHWKSDDEAWRKKQRFERVQMEGTRDPRRGGSGTTR